MPIDPEDLAKIEANKRAWQKAIEDATTRPRAKSARRSAAAAPCGGIRKTPTSWR